MVQLCIFVSIRELMSLLFHMMTLNAFRILACQKVNCLCWVRKKRPLDVMGKMNSTLSYSDTDIVQDVYVSRSLTQPHLGWPAIKRMGLFSHLSNVEVVERYRLMFPALFIGLGKLEQECHIELTPDAQPHCLYALRSVQLPLQETVNAELQRLQDEGVK